MFELIFGANQVEQPSSLDGHGSAGDGITANQRFGKEFCAAAVNCPEQPPSCITRKLRSIMASGVLLRRQSTALKQRPNPYRDGTERLPAVNR